MDVTIERLDELKDTDLDGTPPCTIFRSDYGRVCGQPAMARLIFNCCTPVRSFVCQECLNRIQAGEFFCTTCYRVAPPWRQS